MEKLQKKVNEPKMVDRSGVVARSEFVGFKKLIQIRFRDCDPAGILYFGNVYNLAHDCFEDFLKEAKVPWDEWFQSEKYIIPFRHTSCDYFAPLVQGQNYVIFARTLAISNSSFEMQYDFCSLSDDGNVQPQKIHATVKTVQVFVDKKTMKKTEIPEKFVKILKLNSN